MVTCTLKLYIRSFALIEEMGGAFKTFPGRVLFVPLLEVNLGVNASTAELVFS